MKTLLALLLAFVTFSGSAQQFPLPPPPVAQTHADSAQLIGQAFRYFRHRERRGLLLVSAAGLAQAGALTNNSSANASLRTGLTITSAAVYTGLLADYLVTLLKYSKKREADALRRFELHQPQPQLVQRMLVAYTLGKRRP